VSSAGPVGIEPTLSVLETDVLPLNYGPYTAHDSRKHDVGKAGVLTSCTGYNIPMHRFRVLPLLLAVFLFCMPLATQAAGLPLFDPNWHIVPDPHTLDATCPEGSPLGIGGVIILLQNLMNAAVALTVIVMTLVIAYAGFLLVTSPFNSENRSKAKTTLLNTFIGVFIVLGAWLVIDFAMKILYNPDATFGGKALGPWNEVLVGGDACIRKADPSKGEGAPLFQFPFTVGPRVDTSVGAGGTGAGAIVVPRTGPGACSASTLKAAAQQAGVALSDSDANTFACIARYESSCGTKTLNYAWGKGSSAAGPFQVLLDSNSACYENTACQKAAGVSGRLNCSAAFTGGNPNSNKTLVEQCVRAAANLNCSVAAAVCVKNKQGFGAWTADKSSRMQQACISGR
jgi:hypothetical protein